MEYCFTLLRHPLSCSFTFLVGFTIWVMKSGIGCMTPINGDGYMPRHLPSHSVTHTHTQKFQRTSVKLKKGINGPGLESKHLLSSSLDVPDAVFVSGDGHSSGAERLFDWNNRAAPLGFTSVTAADGFSPPLPIAPCLHLFPTMFPTSGLLSYRRFLQEHWISVTASRALMCDG